MYIYIYHLLKLLTGTKINLIFINKSFVILYLILINIIFIKQAYFYNLT